MDRSELTTAIYKSLGSLSDVWFLKIIASFFIAVICSLHVKLLLAFTALVVFDLLTKWIALSKQYLQDQSQNTGLWSCICNIKKARRAGYIKSSAMKHRFAGKIIVYMLLTFGAGMLDLVFKTMEKPEFAVVLVVGYLSVTELLSTIENLQDAGVEEAEKLYEIIEKKSGVK